MIKSILDAYSAVIRLCDTIIKKTSKKNPAYQQFLLYKFSLSFYSSYISICDKNAETLHDTNLDKSHRIPIHRQFFHCHSAEC